MANEKQVFDKIKAQFTRAVKSLPKVLGNEAVNFSLDRFKDQNWIGDSTEPWAPRSTNNKKNIGKAILIQTGRLRRGTRIFSVGENKVVIGNDVPYARIHNYGGNIQRKARKESIVRNRFKKGSKKGKFKKGTTPGDGFTFKASTARMPKRQFLGRSQFLIARLKRVGQAQLLKALK